MLRRRLLQTLLYLPAATLVVYSIYATSAFVALEDARAAWKSFSAYADKVQLEAAAISPAFSSGRSLPEEHTALFATLRKAREAEATLSVDGVLEAGRLAESTELPASLKKSDWTREGLATLQEEVEGLRPLKSFTQSLLAERARFLNRLDEAPGKVIPRPSPEIRNVTLRKLFLLNVKEETILLQNKVHYGQFVDRHLASCFDLEKGRFNVPEIGKAVAELKASLAQAPIPAESFVSATELLRFFEKATPEAARFQAWRNQALVAVALSRYREEHGAFPTWLAALQPEFLAELPPDPLTGDSLLYRESGNGFTLSATSWQRAEGDKGAPDWTWSGKVERTR